MNRVCFNGRLLTRDAPVLNADNKGYRYGDGLFETMRMIRGQIPLAALHFERLFSGLKTLDFNISSRVSPGKFKEEILLLCKENNCEKLARVRLSVSRGNGGINDGKDKLEYLVEC
ncbi:MAG TPA: aminotransferase class IV, partial [Chitinophagaceae bacterium]|nr:aminotransferase class IV [Chitinophagaceae bacterium]